jgi:hypothetical protein
MPNRVWQAHATTGNMRTDRLYGISGKGSMPMKMLVVRKSKCYRRTMQGRHGIVYLQGALLLFFCLLLCTDLCAEPIYLNASAFSGTTFSAQTAGPPSPAPGNSLSSQPAVITAVFTRSDALPVELATGMASQTTARSVAMILAGAGMIWLAGFIRYGRLHRD